ncbi:MAG: DUF4920 domain-containing protein [Rhodothermales bacterium]|nr:DUF4920 domain-containing protein [Rhodothermales bacterium]
MTLSKRLSAKPVRRADFHSRRQFEMLCCSLVVSSAIFLAGCQPSSIDSAGSPIDYASFETFGDESGHAQTTNNVYTPTKLVSELSDVEGTTVTLVGEVREVCQMAGCWLTMDGSIEGSEEPAPTIRIAVARDDSGSYVFTVPKDISGRTAYVTGFVESQEVDAETLEHYEEDAAKAAESVRADDSDQGEHEDSGHHDSDNDAGDQRGDDDSDHNDGHDDVGAHDMDEEKADAPEAGGVTEIRITADGVSLVPVSGTD